jgi:D-alanine-D-alanine ligase-like ATP-grasp enzyme
MHLTNYSLNKNSQKFKAPSDEFQNDDKSSKQLYTSFIKKLTPKDSKYLQDQVTDVSQKVIIALEPYLKNAYHCFISSNHTKPRCFQILGLDILIDESLNAWLMEVNANPSLNVYNDKELPNGDIE